MNYLLEQNQKIKKGDKTADTKSLDECNYYSNTFNALAIKHKFDKSGKAKKDTNILLSLNTCSNPNMLKSIYGKTNG
jgi:hypothetical protein